jgi:release factor glutamine methyltransferase
VHRNSIAFARKELAKRLSLFLSEREANAESWRWFDEGIGWDRARIAAHGEERVSEDILGQLDAWFERRQHGEPWAYILGWVVWGGRRFLVSPATLIPRPETELVLESALRLAERLAPRCIADVGTGAGILGIALALNASLNVAATDISSEALAVAKENARRHNARLTFACGDLLDPISDPIDMVVSNPPYVDPEDADSIQRELSFEPKSALFASDHGMEVVTRLLKQGIVRNVKALVSEIGSGQGGEIMARAMGMGWQSVSIECDASGHDRVLTATLFRDH